MSTTSPNFGLVLATTSDTVSVTSHVANNFSTLDTVLGVAHTGTGQLKSGLVLVTPTLSSPSLSGTMSGGSIVATTGNFQTITATGGAVTVNTFNIGTYAYPTAIGSTSAILTVVTGNAQWAAAAPNTGANQALSNLTTIAVNTNMNTFTGGFVTVDRLITTSGAFTGLTVFQATTGTFAGSITVSGTATINAVNCTGGSITAGGFAIGTYSYPATVGSTGQILTVTTGNAVFLAPNLVQTQAYFNVYMNTATQVLAVTGTTSATLLPDTTRFDSAAQFGTATGGYTITASGYYMFGCSLVGTYVTGSVSGVVVSLSGSGNPQPLIFVDNPVNSGRIDAFGSVLTIATTNQVYSFLASISGNAVAKVNILAIGTAYPTFWGYKVPDR